MSLRPPYCEDWLELGDDFISDEIVQSTEIVIGREDIYWASSCVERYIQGAYGILVWFWVRDDPMREYRAILYSDSFINKIRPTLHVKINDTKKDSRRSMFVIIPQSAENADGVSLRSYGIRTLVRLQVLNQVASGRREIVNTFKLKAAKFGLIIGKRCFADREGDFVIVPKRPSGTMDAGETPDNIIHDRTQVMDTFARNDPEALRRLLDNPETKLKMLLSAFIVKLGDHTMRFIVKENANFALELIDMYHCPCESQTWDVFHIIHSDGDSAYAKFKEEQNTKKEKNDAEQPKNSKGHQNSHSEAERLLKESEESRPALTVPPPEAIASASYPVHRDGGCIATSTHSDNPEGAS